jgi:hypothetical protein
MEIDIPTWAISLLVAFVGILGAFAVHRFGAFRAASVKFRAAVLDTLTGLYPTPVDWPDSGNAVDHMLTAAFPALQKAVAEFREALPGRKRSAFDKAWLTYRAGPHGTSTNQQGPNYQYMGYHESGTSDASGRAKSKELFHANVQRLLSFANET